MIRFVLAPVLAAGLLASLPARADRPPTPEERAQIEAVLKREGFTKWGTIEFDDQYFEVDDAYAADGRKFDLDLDPKTFAIVKRDPD